MPLQNEGLLCIYTAVETQYFESTKRQFDIKIPDGIRVIRRAILTQSKSEFCDKREQKPNLFGLCRVQTKS